MSDTRNRRSLFGRSGRTLAVLAALLVLSPAVLLAQSDRSEVRAGNRDFKKGLYREAEIDYKRALIADSASVTAKYNLGNALYKAESYNEAELYFKDFKDLGDTLKNLSPSRASDYFHNSGNLALKQKKYQEAVEAFKESLRLEPDNFETKSNLAYAQKMLKDQQQNQQQNQQQDQNQDQDQNQQNQDQNQNNDQQNDQNQDQDQNQQNQDQQNQQQNQPQISPQAAQQMLQAIEDKEKQTQDKVKKAKALKEKSKEKEKNW